MRNSKKQGTIWSWSFNSASWPQEGVLVGILHLKERHKMSTFGISCVISKTHLKYYQGTYHSLGFRAYDMFTEGRKHNCSPSPFIDLRSLGVHFWNRRINDSGASSKLWTFQLPVAVRLFQDDSNPYRAPTNRKKMYFLPDLPAGW